MKEFNERIQDMNMTREETLARFVQRLAKLSTHPTGIKKGDEDSKLPERALKYLQDNGLDLPRKNHHWDDNCKCGESKECGSGTAHPSNWYCPLCE